jgi:hypothetical protein
MYNLFLLQAVYSLNYYRENLRTGPNVDYINTSHGAAHEAALRAHQYWTKSRKFDPMMVMLSRSTVFNFTPLALRVDKKTGELVAVKYARETQREKQKKYRRSLATLAIVALMPEVRANRNLAVLACTACWAADTSDPLCWEARWHYGRVGLAEPASEEEMDYFSSSAFESALPMHEIMQAAWDHKVQVYAAVGFLADGCALDTYPLTGVDVRAMMHPDPKINAWFQGFEHYDENSYQFPLSVNKKSMVTAYHRLLRSKIGKKDQSFIFLILGFLVHLDRKDYVKEVLDSWCMIGGEDARKYIGREVLVLSALTEGNLGMPHFSGGAVRGRLQFRGQHDYGRVRVEELNHLTGEFVEADIKVELGVLMNETIERRAEAILFACNEANLNSNFYSRFLNYFPEHWIVEAVRASAAYRGKSLILPRLPRDVCERYCLDEIVLLTIANSCYLKDENFFKKKIPDPLNTEEILRFCVGLLVQQEKKLEKNRIEGRDVVNHHYNGTKGKLILGMNFERYDEDFVHYVAFADLETSYYSDYEPDLLIPFITDKLPILRRLLASVMEHDDKRLCFTFEASLSMGMQFIECVIVREELITAMAKNIEITANRLHMFSLCENDLPFFRRLWKKNYSEGASSAVLLRLEQFIRPVFTFDRLFRHAVRKTIAAAKAREEAVALDKSAASASEAVKVPDFKRMRTGEN